VPEGLTATALFAGSGDAKAPLMAGLFDWMGEVDDAKSLGPFTLASPHDGSMETLRWHAIVKSIGFEQLVWK
jgi:hypothetical protein